jgi:hypothetical protein
MAWVWAVSGAAPAVMAASQRLLKSTRASISVGGVASSRVWLRLWSAASRTDRPSCSSISRQRSAPIACGACCSSAVGRVGDGVLDVGGKRRVELVPRVVSARGGCGDLREELLLTLPERGFEQLGLVGEVVVDGALADSCRACDGIDGGRGVPVIGEPFGGRLEQRDPGQLFVFLGRPLTE